MLISRAKPMMHRCLQQHYNIIVVVGRFVAIADSIWKRGPSDASGLESGHACERAGLKPFGRRHHSGTRAKGKKRLPQASQVFFHSRLLHGDRRPKTVYRPEERA